MKKPFCGNEKCVHNKIKVESSIGLIFIEEGDFTRTGISRHVYADPNRYADNVLHLCGICHNAIKMVR